MKQTTNTRTRILRAATLGACIATGVATAWADPAPQPGGTLQVITMFPGVPALSWDPADWNWKLMHDAGQIYEQLITADLSKAVRNGGKYRFIIDGWVPSDAMRGELAESWQLKDDPLRIEMKLRKGVMFPEKPGVMASRELTADDVVFSFERYAKSPKRIPTFHDELVAKVEASDRHTVVFLLKKYNAEWEYRLGYGYYSAIMPKEVAEAGAANWKHVNGTGPFMLSDYVHGNAATYVRNPAYWGKDRFGGQEHPLPLVDRLVYRVVRDEATQHALLRSGRIDILELIRWNAVDELRKSAPQLQWSRRLATLGQFLALRTDVKPFDDVRVRRALNLAVDQQEIVRAYYGGNAEILGFPLHPEFIGYYEPLEAMPASVKELFGYDPQKAKALLAEAGYPDGFTFKVQVAAIDFDHLELLPLLSAYLAKVGVKMDVQQLEYPAFLSMMTAKKHGPGFLARTGHNNPVAGVRKVLESGNPWNLWMLSDPQVDARAVQLLQERDESQRRTMVQELTRDMLDRALGVWLPTPYVYMAWWPWVKNYGGEFSTGAYRPGPIYARIWIDQELKKKMGH
jgi:peptide/nickel transport system substrate-binding protein